MSILRAYVLPHPPLAVPAVGRGSEKDIADTIDGFNAVAEDIKALAPETIILASPHSIMYSDYIHISPGREASGDMSAFRAPDARLRVSYDAALVSAICRECELRDIPAGRDGERDPALDHGSFVPLYYIMEKYRDFKLVRTGLSGLSLSKHYEYGKAIKAAVQTTGTRAVFLASGDLAHCQKEDGPYGFRQAGPDYDARLMDVLSSGELTRLLDFDEGFLSAAMECGHRAFCVMAGALHGENINVRVLSHEAPFGVGYGTAIIESN